MLRTEVKLALPSGHRRVERDREDLDLVFVKTEPDANGGRSCGHLDQVRPTGIDIGDDSITTSALVSPRSSATRFSKRSPRSTVTAGQGSSACPW